MHLFMSGLFSALRFYSTVRSGDVMAKKTQGTMIPRNSTVQYLLRYLKMLKKTSQDLEKMTLIIIKFFCDFFTYIALFPIKACASNCHFLITEQ